MPERGIVCVISLVCAIMSLDITLRLPASGTWQWKSGFEEEGKKMEER